MIDKPISSLSDMELLGSHYEIHRLYELGGDDKADLFVDHNKLLEEIKARGLPHHKKDALDVSFKPEELSMERRILYDMRWLLIKTNLKFDTEEHAFGSLSLLRSYYEKNDDINTAWRILNLLSSMEAEVTGEGIMEHERSFYSAEYELRKDVDEEFYFDQAERLADIKKAKTHMLQQVAGELLKKKSQATRTDIPKPELDEFLSAVKHELIKRKALSEFAEEELGEEELQDKNPLYPDGEDFYQYSIYEGKGSKALVVILGDVLEVFNITVEETDTDRHASSGRLIHALTIEEFEKLSPDMKKVENGSLKLGTRKETFYEYFLGDKILLFRFVPESKENKTDGYWLSWTAEDDTPYVLSSRAIGKDWMPPVGHSALPQRIELRVPKTLQYWKEGDEDMRKKLANMYQKKFVITSKLGDNAYVGYCTCHNNTFVLETTKEFELSNVIDMIDVKNEIKVILHKKGEYYLIKHFWKEKLTKKDVKEHWDLVLNDEMFVCPVNPFDEDTGAILKEKYFDGYEKLSDGEPFYLEPGSKANVSKSLDAWSCLVEKGEFEIIEEKEKETTIDFKGEIARGRYNVVRNTPISARISEHKNTVALKSIIIDKFLSNGGVTITGVAIAPGVWNGNYYSREVIEAIAPEIVGLDIGVYSHDEWWNVGKVTSYMLLADGSLFFEGTVTDATGVSAFQTDDLNGFSAEFRVIADPITREILHIQKFERVVGVEDPACKTCGIDGCRNT